MVYLPDGNPGPGRIGDVDIEVVRCGPAELVLPEASVQDVRGGQLFNNRALAFDPAGGGGPLAGAEADRQARAFGLVNTAFHLQRALRYFAGLLQRPLPHLVVRIGMHDQPRRWGGGHYRLPGRAMALESKPVVPDGEIHLGGGARFLTPAKGTQYFHAPAHNAAIIYHEVGHHLCRHTADFRLNRLRPPREQTNKKIALDEGTADVFTAALLGTPDIYGWHRRTIAERDQRRRKLDGHWTMAYFRGGNDGDPHADGTLWASACWTSRERVAAFGADPVRFDALLVRGLELLGDATPFTRTHEALHSRRDFSRLLAAMAHADTQLAPTVLAAMAEHGIRPNASNTELTEAARRRAVDQAHR
ncbi:hypothetical protein ABZ904_50690 [Streptomyces sp. NPDC046900]|uniref:hypothetical protein n=1 Tax=Streptomyces sp. NPDC046900 TaxID=3155473 RepID=UPI00340B0356